MDSDTPRPNNYLTPADIHPATRYLSKNEDADKPAKKS